MRFVHGGSRSVLYRRWMAMRSRCGNKNHKQWKDYGGRGIKICDEWMDFQTFRAWANDNGYEEGLQIDRIDNNGDYCPENCRFVTHRENMRNMRRNVHMEHDGRMYTIPEMCDITGLPYNTIYNRYAGGWSVEEILNKSKSMKSRERKKTLSCGGDEQ